MYKFKKTFLYLLSASVLFGDLKVSLADQVPVSYSVSDIVIPELEYKDVLTKPVSHGSDLMNKLLPNTSAATQWWLIILGVILILLALSLFQDQNNEEGRIIQ